MYVLARSAPCRQMHYPLVMPTAIKKGTLAAGADLMAIPEDSRFHEIIDGDIVQKAVPTPIHGAAQRKLSEKYRASPACREVSQLKRRQPTQRQAARGSRQQCYPQDPRLWCQSSYSLMVASVLPSARSDF